MSEDAKTTFILYPVYTSAYYYGEVNQLTHQNLPFYKFSNRLTQTNLKKKSKQQYWKNFLPILLFSTFFFAALVIKQSLREVYCCFLTETFYTLWHLLTI